ncbi:protein kinase [Arthrobacter sp. ov118]|uniref:serine/threonine protein kinase n=1 Tax=Arthrobacter sp. ov118 TaxID=1761747 RepID=UPI0008E77F12|nr:protein kinase [Arthrobacter sp. ov118]SFU08522.1 Serine/threonine protein kinase [Arthrobacter sp. ov118]
MEEYLQAGGRAPAVHGPAPVVDGYDVGRCLGRGGSASVWLVTERSTRRDFALKCFEAAGAAPAEGIAIREAEAAMRREVRILSVLEHNHLIRAHAVVRLQRRGGGDGDDGGGLGVALDYAPGGSLASLVAARGRLGPGETVTVLTPIAQVLAYLHGQGFTHGDLAPGNVLFTASGKPLLADLGVARMVAEPSPVSAPGTKGFQDPAPEDVLRAGLQPERDMYSLAALGWYCLTGRAPEPGAERPPLRLLAPEVPAALAAALEAGLSAERRQRPAASEFAALVYRSAQAEPVDLSVSVHPTVLPELLTRRAVQTAQRRRGAVVPWRRMAAAVGFLHRNYLHRNPHPNRPESSPVPVQPRRSRARIPGPGRRPGSIRATGLHRRSPKAAAQTLGARTPGVRKTSARRPLPPRLAAVVLVGVVLLGGAWLLTGGGSVPDAVAVLFPDHSADHSADQGSDQGPSIQTEPAAAGGPASAVRPDLDALLASADPTEAVRGLARLRSLALSSGDFGLLDAVNAPTSAAAAADGVIRTKLSGSGHVLAGFSTSLTRIETTADSSPARAVVAITAVSSGYQVIDAHGKVVDEVPAAAAQQLQLVLVPVDGRWRIQDVLPPGPDAG